MAWRTFSDWRAKSFGDFAIQLCAFSSPTKIAFQSVNGGREIATSIVLVWGKEDTCALPLHWGLPNSPPD